MSLHVVRMEVKKLSIMATDGMSRNTLSNWVEKKKYKTSDVKVLWHPRQTPHYDYASVQGPVIIPDIQIRV